MGGFHVFVGFVQFVNGRLSSARPTFQKAGCERAMVAVLTIYSVKNRISESRPIDQRF